MSVIPATWEAKVGGRQVQCQSEKHSKTLSQKWAGNAAQRLSVFFACFSPWIQSPVQQTPNQVKTKIRSNFPLNTTQKALHSLGIKSQWLLWLYWSLCWGTLLPWLITGAAHSPAGLSLCCSDSSRSKLLSLSGP